MWGSSYYSPTPIEDRVSEFPMSSASIILIFCTIAQVVSCRNMFYLVLFAEPADLQLVKVIHELASCLILCDSVASLNITVFFQLVLSGRFGRVVALENDMRRKHPTHP